MPETPAAPKPPLPAARWRVQSTIAGAGILVGSYDLAAISVALAPLRTRWHLASGVVTTLGTATLLGMLLGSLATGFLADRFGRRRIVVADVALFILTAAAGALAPDFAVLAGARLLSGFAVGVDFAVVFPFVAETAPRARRGEAMAWIMWSANFGTLAAYGAGALLLHISEAAGWRFALALGGLLALPLLALRRELLDPPQWHAARLPDLAGILRSVTHSSRRRPLSVAAVATFCYQVGDQGIGLVLPFLLAAVLVTSAAGGALGAAAVKAVTIPASTLTIVLIERLGRPRLQVAGFLGRGLAFVLLGVLLMMSAALSAWLICLLLAIGYFFGAAGPDKTTVILPAESFPSEVRSASQGISQAAGRLGGIVGVTAYGLLAGAGGPGAALLFFGAAALLGAGVTLAAPALQSSSGPAPPHDGGAPVWEEAAADAFTQRR